MSYNPDSIPVLTDVTINSVEYAVLSFEDSGAEVVTADTATSAGAHSKRRAVSGVRTATMTLQRESSSQVVPAQFLVVSYQGSDWAIMRSSGSQENTGNPTISLELYYEGPTT